jgi:hypothetical protein
MKFDRPKMTEALRRVAQRMHYPLEAMLVRVRWYAARVEPAQPRGDDGRARRLRRPFHLALLVDQDVAAAGGRVASAQAPSRPELANGRDLRQGWRPVEILVPGSRPRWRHRRLPAACDARPRCGARVLGADHRPARRAREDHHRQERRQHMVDRVKPDRPSQRETNGAELTSCNLGRRLGGGNSNLVTSTAPTARCGPASRVEWEGFDQR